MLRALLWGVVNVLQVSFFLFWSFLWQSVSILLRFILWNQKVPLMVARYIWSPALLWTTRAPLRVEGIEKIDFSKPHIFVSNHQSTLDIPVAFVTLPVPLRFIAKKELLYIPFLGWYMWATGMIFVDRRQTEKAKASLRRAGRLIREGASIIAYPEGTRSDDGSILPFKKGVFIVAIEAGVPIVPVAIEGTRLVMPKNSFRLRPHEIRVAVGSPIPTEGLSPEEKDRLIERTRKALIELHLSIGGKGGSSEPQETSTASGEP